MADDDSGDKQPTNWLDVVKSLTEGGIPQIIAGPAGKAISRLIAGAANIPAAWLEQKAQRIKDETAARTTIMTAVAAASSQAAVADQALLERALDRHISEIYRKQENREEVAKQTVKALVDDPPTAESVEPEADWMNAFERHAENASSESMREVWGRVLAGEIRKPNSISLATLNFFSLMDQPLAKAIEEVFPWIIFGDGLLPAATTKVNLKSLLMVRDSGLVFTLDTDVTKTATVQPASPARINVGSDYLLCFVKETTSIPINIISLTRIAQEIASVIPFQTDPEAVRHVVEQLKAHDSVLAVIAGPPERYPGDAMKVFVRSPAG